MTAKHLVFSKENLFLQRASFIMDEDKDGEVEQEAKGEDKRTKKKGYFNLLQSK